MSDHDPGTHPTFCPPTSHVLRLPPHVNMTAIVERAWRHPGGRYIATTDRRQIVGAVGTWVKGLEQCWQVTFQREGQYHPQAYMVKLTAREVMHDAREYLRGTMDGLGEKAVRQMWHELCQREAAQARVNRDAAAMLRDPECRMELYEAIRQEKAYTARLDYLAARQVIAQARQVLHARESRRIDRLTAEAARTRPVAVGTEVLRKALALRHQKIAVIVGELLAPHVVDANVATCRYGHGGQDVADNGRYSKKWHRSHGCAHYAAAGVQVVGRQIVLQDSRGREVCRLDLPRRTYRGTDSGKVAVQMLGAIHRRRLDAVGPQGQDDRVQIAMRDLYLLCRGVDPEGRPAMLVADRPAVLIDAWTRKVRSRRTSEPVVQVVVRDPATGCRHHLTVPPRFGRPITGRERVKDRIKAAIAWTFDMKPEEYQPAKAS